MLFSVPQISMLIDKLAPEHYNMLKFYCNLWNKYSDAFINGKFIPLNPHCRYNVLKGIYNDTFVCTYHSNEIININKDYDTLVIINGTSSNDLHLINESVATSKKLTVYDCLGNIISNKIIKLKLGYNNFILPPCGVAEFK